MNCELLELAEVEVDQSELKEVLKILLHSIIFQRALGEHRHRDCESELFDVSYMRCESRLIETKVEEHIESISSNIATRSAGVDTIQAQIGVAFFERRSRPTAFGLFRSEEKVRVKPTLYCRVARVASSRIGETQPGLPAPAPHYLVRRSCHGIWDLWGEGPTSPAQLSPCALSFHSEGRRTTGAYTHSRYCTGHLGALDSSSQDIPHVRP